jgi:hypothetical protein
MFLLVQKASIDWKLHRVKTLRTCSSKLMVNITDDMLFCVECCVAHPIAHQITSPQPQVTTNFCRNDYGWQKGALNYQILFVNY